MLPPKRRTTALLIACTLTISSLSAPIRASDSSSPLQSQLQPSGKSSTTKPAVAPAVPKDYVIGVQDVLSVVFWNAKELSGDVVVRPDGKISVPLLNDLPAAGMKPEELGELIGKSAAKFVRDPGATVIVKEIRSRKIYVIGAVSKSGTFTLGDEMTVVQAIGEAGGFLEGAKTSDVVIVRTENGVERRHKFNYNDFVKGKNIHQNIRLLPGDTILVR